MNTKRWLLVLVANMAAFVAVLGIQPTSWGVWYQPEVPEELKR
jgi:cyclic lactone autoinducer peptide